MIISAKAIASGANARASMAAGWVFARPYRLLTLVVGNWFVCSGLYAWIEGRGPVEGGWWGLVTGSTVGYGDQYPTTTAGRGVAAWLIVTSVVGIALLTGQVAGWCNRDAFKHEEQEGLKADAAAAREAAEQAHAEVVALRAELAEIRELLAERANR